MISKVQVAVAKVKARKKRKAIEAALEARDSSMVERILGKVKVPRGIDGQAGRDAPDMADILKAITPMLPETIIKHTSTETRVEMDDATFEANFDKFLEAKLPEMLPEDKPVVEQIVPEVDLSGLVTHKQMKKHLQMIQAAIMQSSGGGGRPDLTGITENAQEIKELSEALNTLINNLTVQGLTTQDILRSVNEAIVVSSDELKLLNAKTEEAYETKITLEDIE